MSYLHTQIPDRDQAILKDEFSKRQNELPKVRDWQWFVHNILWRLYTELCCSPAGRDVEDSNPHAGNAYREWVDQEVHYALEGKHVDDAKYAEVYQNVVRAAAARAAELFAAWGRHSPEEDAADKRNLRASLDPYLPEHLRKSTQTEITSHSLHT